MDSYNNDAFKNYNEKALDACPNCARTFLPDRLAVHLKSCNKAHGKPADSGASPMKSGLGGGGGGIGGGGGMGSPQKSPGMAVKPKALVCYICGREYGTASLEIHLKTCKKKWEQEQMQKPRHERKPCPQPPKNFDDMIAGRVSQTDMDSYNNDAFKNYNEKALDACPNCGRTFLPDRLQVHLRSCNKAHGKSPEPSSTLKPGSLGGSLGGGGGSGNKMSASMSPSKPAFIQKPKTVMCYICGREYGTTSIEIHIKSCIKKWEIEEGKKPLKERRPVPQPPKQFDDVVIGAKSG